ncbi:MAG: Npt1/Npt2 family nucleotide transporter [Acidobacteria bacterium]|nr:Npt1/Npt2 family nucleotide transporter [Acidobacteriota bacterium]
MIPPNRTTQKGGETLNRLLRLFSVRPQEALPALLMTVYFFLAMACVSMVKSLQIALYLSRVGFDWRLPSLYAVLVLLSGLIVLLYRYLARQYSHLGMALSTLGFFLLSLVFFWFLVGKEQFWVYLTFYIWGGLFSLLVPTLGWVIALDLYSTREAKRLFALFGTGGILGGACGGYYIALVSGTLDARWLLIHVFAILIILQWVLRAIYRCKGSRLGLRLPTPSETSSAPATASSLGDLLASPYLTHLAGIVLVSAFTTTLIDLQYQWFLEQRYPGSEEEITWFVGTLLGTMYVFAALFQLFATRSVLRNFGVGVALLVLPLALLGGSASIVILAGFGAIVTFKGIDGFLRPSIHRTGLEVLYVPISSPQTVTLKSFIDLAVFRFGDALGAAVFLGVSSLLVTPVTAIQITILLAALVWAYLAFQLGKQYVEILRHSLEGKSARRLPPSLLLEGAGAQNALLAALQSLNPNKVHFALEQLAAVSPRSEEGITEFPGHGEELLQSQVPSLFPVSQGWLETVEPLVNHVDPRVGAAAFHVFVRQEPTKYLKHLKKKLESQWVPDTVYLHYLDLYSEDPGRFLRPSQLLQWSRDERPDRVPILARLMGKIKSPAFLPLLRQWMSGLPGEPARAAIETIGLYAEPRLLDALISLLKPNWSRPAACRALIHYGDAAVSRLRELLRDPAVGPFIARQLPFILTRINTSSARAGLVTALYSADPAVSYSALKGLNKIRDDQDLSYTQGSFIPLLQIWAKQYYELVNIESIASKREGNAWRLLRKTNSERMNWTIEKIFRGLELFLPRGDAYFSYLGYISSKQELRENAIELIDTRIKGELRQTLLPIFSEESRQELARTGRRLFHLPSDRDGIALDALSDVDSWLRCCVMAALREQPSPILEKAVRLACQDVDSLVQETAQWVLTSMATTPAGPHERRAIRMLTTIEKVLLLQEVELFSSASTDHLAQLAQLCQEKMYKAGETLFQKGEPHSKFFLLVEGSVRLENQENEETVEKRALDFWSWVGQTRHEVSAQCVDDCTVLLLPFQDLVDLLCGEPGLSWAILQHLASAGRERG